ncbi:hypothetical protein [uncultured Muribaculum sp.]|uniref:hypothetical protein n=1 Tax=uncultured Muribaculum sp. TaxID=1918613 RepID=UPI002648EBF5|nr:hypothetical protein [uncultured Muribaculum sp.]
MLEGRHDDAAGTPCHALHISEDERRGDAVGLTSAPPGDNNGSVRADKLRKALWAVEINFVVGGFHENE